jgi:glycolate oxidase FAD binding subunit
MDEAPERFAETIRSAAARGEALRIRGGGTKDFYGEAPRGERLDTTAYRGIVDYDPTELVLTARCGTPLAEIERAMQAEGQMLGFEPPRFGEGATFGGCLAAGLSGPRRPFAGSVRDFVLGVRLLDGQGRDLRFGGRVMKNVAGYDVARLTVGALGTLGVILEASIKAVPLPRTETTVCLEMTQAEAIRTMNTWAGRSLPISATCHVHDPRSSVRAPFGGSAGRASRSVEGRRRAPPRWRALLARSAGAAARAPAHGRHVVAPVHSSNLAAPGTPGD